MKKRITKALLFLISLVAIACFASCEQLLSDGIDTHSHTYGEWSDDTATCTEAGTQKRACKICEDVQTRKTNPLGHDMEKVADKAVSCTETGYQSYEECSRCGHSIGTKTEALGHSLAVWYGSTATCTEDGTEYADCSRCDFKTSRTVKAPGHSLTDGCCSVCHKENILVLVEDGIANFTVVSTAASGSTGKILADNFVKLLRAAGITVADAVIDLQSDKITDCEIIIGKDARVRGNDVNVSSNYLGRNGEAIKLVGERIVIAASTDEALKSLFDSFVKNELHIDGETKELSYLETTKAYNYENIQQYLVDSITINSIGFEYYDIVLDIASYMPEIEYPALAINSFKENVLSSTGYNLDVITSDRMISGGSYFIIRYSEDAGEEGFRAYVDGRNFIVECSYKNAFDKAFEEFANTYFLEAEGDVTIDSSYTFKKDVSRVYYEDFGAVGDGETCDFEAIYNAHVFANAGGQKVYGKEGAVYFISADNFIRPIPVKTDVDFLGATFIVNDEGDTAFLTRQNPLFSIERDYDSKLYTTYALENFYGISDIHLERGALSLEWFAPFLEGKSLVQITNNNHKDYVRHGSNQNNGESRTDIVIVDTDGNIYADTPVAYDFDEIASLNVYRVDDKEITIENGTFINICCKSLQRTFHDKVVVDANGNATTVRTTHANVYRSYKRGLGIFRSNVTIKNLTHKMQDEPEFGSYNPESGYTPDELQSNGYGSRHESYPYYGFLFVENSYNLNVIDTKLTGHTTYYEDKPATVSTGGKQPNPVPMGTYDFVLEYSANVTFKNVDQISETGIGDSRYWGIMSSNGSRNLTFEDCEINRFDAHRGFYNASLKNTTIGHTINVVGQGTFVLDGVTKIIGPNFINLRGDYGATFRGDMSFKDCVFENYPSYNSKSGGTLKSTRNTNAVIISSGFDTTNYGWSDTNYYGAYWLWDFGYTCYMPENITVENFTVHKRSNGKTYMFNDLPDIIFESTYVEGEEPTSTTVRYPYQVTKSITYVGMDPFVMCKGTTNTSLGYTYEKLNSIPVHRKEKE